MQKNNVSRDEHNDATVVTIQENYKDYREK